jgi:hypothetical protein
LLRKGQWIYKETVNKKERSKERLRRKKPFYINRSLNEQNFVFTKKIKSRNLKKYKRKICNAVSNSTKKLINYKKKYLNNRGTNKNAK